MLQKIILLFFAIILQFCPISYAKNTLTTAYPSNVGVLNPHDYYPNEMFAQVLSYDGLVHFNGEDIEPALAKSWTLSEDKKTYTFTIDTAIQFSDGSMLDAFIIEKNFNAIMKNKKRHSWLASINLIHSYKAINKNTFEITLSSPYPLFLTELSLPRPYRILGLAGFKDPAIDSTDTIKAPIGTGPWVLVETKLGLYDRFIKNPYYRHKTGDFDELFIYVLPDANSRILALETGQVDILFGEGNFNLENFVRLQQNPKFSALKSDERLTNMIVLNSARNATQDIAVRKAILHAVNKDTIIQYILKNQEYKADTIFNPKTDYFTNKNTFAYDIAKAKELLKNAGYTQKGAYVEKDGKILTLNLHYLGIDAKQKAISEAIQADLAKIGIKLELVAEENTIFTNLSNNGEFDLIYNRTWGPPYEPTSYIGSMRAPSHADYQGQRGLKNKNEIAQKITQMLQTADEKKFATLHYEIINALQESAVYLPISFEPDMVIYNAEKIDNFHFGPMTSEPLLHLLTMKK